MESSLAGDIYVQDDLLVLKRKKGRAGGMAPGAHQLCPGGELRVARGPGHRLEANGLSQGGERGGLQPPAGHCCEGAGMDLLVQLPLR